MTRKGKKGKRREKVSRNEGRRNWERWQGNKREGRGKRKKGRKQK